MEASVNDRLHASANVIAAMSHARCMSCEANLRVASISPTVVIDPLHVAYGAHAESVSQVHVISPLLQVQHAQCECLSMVRVGSHWVARGHATMRLDYMYMQPHI